MFNLTHKPPSKKMFVAMVDACENLKVDNWSDIKLFVINEMKSLVTMIEWLKKMKQYDGMDAERARVHMDIIRNTMRIRLITLPGVDIILAERIMNTCYDSIRKMAFDYLGWIVI
jgi:hypothetical protein